MIAAILLAVMTSWPATTACLQTMDGPVFHGDPTDRGLVSSDVWECQQATREQSSRPVLDESDKRAKLFLLGRLYDREATLLEMGMHMPGPALDAAQDAQRAFQRASTLSGDADYQDAVSANLRLIDQQLTTLRAEVK